MRWFFPSWNGDVRIEADEQRPDLTRMTVIRPTANERRILTALGKLIEARGWKSEKESASFGFWKDDGPSGQTWEIEVPFLVLGPWMTRFLKPGVATLTAVRIGEDVAVHDGTRDDLGDWVRSVLATPVELADALEKQVGKKKSKKTGTNTGTNTSSSSAATTVGRPTPCCPDAIQGALEPATEVLLAFLTEEQKEQWLRERRILAVGSHTGHRYLLCHRHGETARRLTKVAYDLEDHDVLHFHDWRVPPEEEVLAAKLILEHREPWLRNEATCLGDHDMVFPNPFGSYNDGIPDADFTDAIGAFLRASHEFRGDASSVRRLDRAAKYLLSYLGCRGAS